MDRLPKWLPQPHNHPFTYDRHGLGPVDVFQPGLWACVGMMFFNPIVWNFVARNEYRNKTLTKTFGSPYLGCYALGLTIFGLGLLRDVLYERVLRSQPHSEVLAHPLIQAAGWGLVAAGQVLVITSIYALGITGTYLGDYFGILMTKRVTAFPFNILSDPMYVGSTLSFLGGALLYRSPAGLGLTALVWTVYSAALQLEGPFTDRIYSAAHKKSESDATSTTSIGRKPRVSGVGAGSTPTSSASTPRKSSRLQAKAGSEAGTDDESHAYTKPTVSSTSASASVPAPIAGSSSGFYAAVASTDPGESGATL